MMLSTKTTPTWYPAIWTRSGMVDPATPQTVKHEMASIQHWNGSRFSTPSDTLSKAKNPNHDTHPASAVDAATCAIVNRTERLLGEINP